MPGVWLVTSQIHLFIRFVLGAGRENSLLVLSLQKLSVSTLEKDTILYSYLHHKSSFPNYLKPFPSNLTSENSGYRDRFYHFTNVLGVLYMEWKIIELVFTLSVISWKAQRNTRATLTLVTWKTRLHYSDLLKTSSKREPWPCSLGSKWEPRHKHKQISFRQGERWSTENHERLSNHCCSKSN